jgi:hypothetical protein
MSSLLSVPESGEHRNWSTCKALFPHAKSVLLQQPKGDTSLCEWALLLYKGAWYTWRKGSIADAEKMAVTSMQVRSKVLSKKHEETLSSMGMVSIIYLINGK